MNRMYQLLDLFSNISNDLFSNIFNSIYNCDMSIDNFKIIIIILVAILCIICTIIQDCFQDCFQPYQFRYNSDKQFENPIIVSRIINCYENSNNIKDICEIINGTYNNMENYHNINNSISIKREFFILSHNEKLDYRSNLTISPDNDLRTILDTRNIKINGICVVPISEYESYSVKYYGNYKNVKKNHRESILEICNNMNENLHKCFRVCFDFTNTCNFINMNYFDNSHNLKNDFINYCTKIINQSERKIFFIMQKNLEEIQSEIEIINNINDRLIEIINNNRNQYQLQNVNLI